MLNDGVAVVGYNILLGAVLGQDVGVFDGLIEFGVVFIGGALVGAIVGVVAGLVLPLIDRLSAATLSLGVAYGSFVLGDDILQAALASQG